jgi:hypothetical protein
VQFEVGGTAIGTPVALDSNGVATMTTTFAAAGTQAVSAVFMPLEAAEYNGSVGTVSVVTVTQSNAIGIMLTTTVAPSGAFTFSVSTSATITMTVNGNTATGAMNPVTITDTRNTYPGWSVLGQETDFTNPTSHPAGDIPGNQLGWAPNGVLSNGVALGGAVTPAAPGLGTTAAVLASAPAGTGFGTSTVGAELILAIPPTVPSGAYAGVLTLTADPAGP